MDVGATLEGDAKDTFEQGVVGLVAGSVMAGDVYRIEQAPHEH